MILPTVLSSLYQFIIFMFLPLLSPFIKTILKDEVMLSLIFSLFPLSIIIFTPIIGHVSDMIGRKRVIFFGILCQIFAVFLYIIAENVWPIIIARLLDGIALTSVVIMGLAKVEDLAENRSRGLVAGFFLSLLNLGAIAGPVAGGYIAERFNVRIVFLIAFNCLLMLLLMALIFYRSNHPKQKISRDAFSFINDIKQFLSIRELQGMAILGIITHATQPAIRVFLPLLIIERFGLSYEHVGIAFFCFALFMMFEFFTGWLADSLGRIKIIIFGTFGIGVGFCLIGFSSSWASLIWSLLFVSFANSLWNSGAWALMSDIGEEHKKQGSVMGSYMSIAEIGALLSYFTSGFIAKFFGVSYLMICNGLLIIFGSAIALLLFKKVHQ